MVWFWHWFVRAPFALIAMAAISAAAGGIVEWSFGLVSFTLAILAADAAHHLGNRARNRRNLAGAPVERFWLIDSPDAQRSYGRVELDGSARERAA